MRLVTRSDFDGLVCAILIKQIAQIDSIQFVHPKDLQDGKFEVTDQDILTNVPYVEGCGLWFDHHKTEFDRVVGKLPYKGECRIAPSAARVVYDYYGGRTQFGDIDEIMSEVDKADSAQFSKEDILNPGGWPLLSFIMDARTGLGRFKDYRISNYQLMYELIDACKTMTIQEVLLLPDVQERVKRYFEENTLFRDMLEKHSWTEQNVVITDLRGTEKIHSGNRFLIYALHPEQNISIWVVDGLRKQNCVFACGHSILNRSSHTDIGSLMRQFGGGGHNSAGTCQIAYETAHDILRVLVNKMMEDEKKHYNKAA